MKKITLFALLFCFCMAAFSQSSKVNNNWYFYTGDAAGVTFNPSNSPSSINDSQAFNPGPSASVSDNNGDLLFYLDGPNIRNGNHVSIGTFGTASEVLIVPNINNSDEYYLFYAIQDNDFGANDGYDFAIISAPDGNNVSILSNNGFLRDENGQQYTDFRLSAKRIAAHYHEDSDTIWIMVLSLNKILTYRLDSNGLNIDPVNVSPSFTVNSTPFTDGSMKVSPDGTKIAMSKRFFSVSLGFDVILADFNASTGVISNPTTIDISNVQDIEFSPDSQSLYLRGTTLQVSKSLNLTPPSSLYVYPITPPFKGFSTTPVEILNGLDGYGSIQLGPDDKIYFNNFAFHDNAYLGAIHNPNDLAANLNIDDQFLLVSGLSQEDVASIPDRVIHLGQENTPFVTTWTVQASDKSITIPTYFGETYDYEVDWGDGTTSSNQTGNATHTYTNAGTYTVSISGTFPRIYFNNFLARSTSNSFKIIAVNQWGNTQWTSMESAFSGCRNLEVFDTQNAPDLSLATSLSLMFFDTNINQPLNHWDVSTITDISLMFGATLFNQPLNNWNVSNVTNMGGLFFQNSSFNQPLDNWDVSNVTNMNRLFYKAFSFNQPLNNWDVGNVTNMFEMFWSVSSFNQSLSNWDVSNVTNMEYMLYGASSFNQSLSTWNVGNVSNMIGMLSYSGLSRGNYETTLIGWSLLPSLQNNVHIGVYNLEYCSSISIIARQNIISTYGWSMNGDTQTCARSAEVDTTIYPNPFNNSLNIKQDQNNQIKQIFVFDKLGNVLITQNIKSFSDTIELNTSKLSRGIYFVRTVYTNGESEVKQIIKE